MPHCLDIRWAGQSYYLRTYATPATPPRYGCLVTRTERRYGDGYVYDRVLEDVAGADPEAALIAGFTAMIEAQRTPPPPV